MSVASPGLRGMGLASYLNALLLYSKGVAKCYCSLRKSREQAVGEALCQPLQPLQRSLQPVDRGLKLSYKYSQRSKTLGALVCIAFRAIAPSRLHHCNNRCMWKVLVVMCTLMSP